MNQGYMLTRYIEIETQSEGKCENVYMKTKYTWETAYTWAALYVYKCVGGMGKHVGRLRVYIGVRGRCHGGEKRYRREIQE